MGSLGDKLPTVIRLVFICFLRKRGLVFGVRPPFLLYRRSGFHVNHSPAQDQRCGASLRHTRPKLGSLDGQSIVASWAGGGGGGLGTREMAAPISILGGSSTASC